MKYNFWRIRAARIGRTTDSKTNRLSLFNQSFKRQVLFTKFTKKLTKLWHSPKRFLNPSFLLFKSSSDNCRILVPQNLIHSGLKSYLDASLPSACSSLYLMIKRDLNVYYSNFKFSIYRLFQNNFHSSLYLGCLSGFFSCCFNVFSMSFSIALDNLWYSSIFCLSSLSRTLRLSSSSTLPVFFLSEGDLRLNATLNWERTSQITTTTVFKRLN